MFKMQDKTHVPIFSMFPKTIGKLMEKQEFWVLELLKVNWWFYGCFAKMKE